MSGGPVPVMPHAPTMPSSIERGHRRPPRVGVGGPARRPAVLVLAELGEHAAVLDDVGVQEAQIDAVEPQRLEAAFDRSADPVLGPFVDRVAEHHLGGDAHAGGQRAREGLGDDALGLAAPVRGREVEQVDARGDGRVHGGDGLVAVGRSPDLAEPAAAEAQDADGPERAERSVLHGGQVGTEW